MAGGMACGGGRCFLIGITRTLVRAGTFERCLAELKCTTATATASCAVSKEPLLRLPGVCIMFGGVMTIDAATSTIYSVLQNNSAASPCGGGVGSSGGVPTGAAGLVRWGPSAAPAPSPDTGWKVLGIDFSSQRPVVAGEPVVCASQALCPTSIAAVP